MMNDCLRSHRSVLELIGHTPMLELEGMGTGPCQLFLKLELQNPGGSTLGAHGPAVVPDVDIGQEQVEVLGL